MPKNKTLSGGRIYKLWIFCDNCLSNSQIAIPFGHVALQKYSFWDGKPTVLKEVIETRRRTYYHNLFCPKCGSERIEKRLGNC